MRSKPAKISNKKQEGEAALKKARRAINNGNKMIQESKILEALAALGKAYVALHFIDDLWEYDSIDMKCYLVISIFRRDMVLKQIDKLAKEIYLMENKK